MLGMNFPIIIIIWMSPHSLLRASGVIFPFLFHFSMKVTSGAIPIKSMSDVHGLTSKCLVINVQAVFFNSGKSCNRSV